MSMHENQISVPVDPALRAFVEREAQRENRTMANWIRRLIAEAARRAAEQSERAA
jgi:hypothetical protein